MKIQAIIIDLDGTLCDSSHRTHFIESHPKDWDSFYNGMSEDPINNWCAQIINKFQDSHDILFVTGRPEKYREITHQWLQKHFHIPDIFELYMRKNGDFRQDVAVKTEIYKEHIEPKYEVLFCIDDRKQVVDQWRFLGLVCLQCAPGDF